MEVSAVEALVLSVFLFCEAFAFIFSVGGNLIVAYVMIFKNKLAKPSNKFVLSVAMSDLLIGLIAVPVAVVLVSSI